MTLVLLIESYLRHGRLWHLIFVIDQQTRILKTWKNEVPLMTFNVVNDMLNWILPDKLFVRILLLLSQYILFEIINMFNQLTVESEKVSNDLSINDGLQRMFSLRSSDQTKQYMILRRKWHYTNMWWSFVFFILIW